MNAEFTKPSTSYKRKMYAALFIIFLIALTGGTVFQLIKISLFPSLDLRLSNMITVVFGTLVSVIVAYFIYSRKERINKKLINEIESRISAERHLEHLNRIYSVLSQTNQSIVHIKEKQKLYDEICRVIIEFGKFKMAWIGELDDGSGSVIPVAFFGAIDGYLDQIAISVKDSRLKEGPTGSAIRSGKYFICNDIENDKRMEPWKDKALKLEFRSSAAFPVILEENRVIGSINIYSSEVNFFKEDEIKLLNEISQDLSYALEMMENEVKRKKAESDLRAALNHNRSLIEVNLDPLVTISPEGKITDANTAAESVMGIAGKELLGTDFADYFTQPDKAGESYRLVFSEGIVRDYPLTIKSKAGHLTDALFNMSVYKNEAGEIAGVFAAARDITNRERFLNELKESETRLKEAQSTAHLGNWELDLRTNKLYWSDEIYRIFEIKPDKFAASYEGFLDAIHPDDREFVNKAYMESVNKKTPYNIDHRLLMKDGRIKYVNERCRTFYDELGEPVRSNGTVHDITIRKLAEEALQAERQRFYNVLEMIPAYVILLTPDYNCSFANKIFRERFGTSKDKKCYEFLFGLNEPCANCETYKVLKTNEPHNWEWKGPDGRNYDIHDYPFVDINGSKLIMEVGIDITEMKTASDELKKTLADLKRSNEELEQFAYVASHDLQEPLRMVSSYTQLLERRYKDKLDSDAKDFIYYAVDGANRMQRLINDLLEYSRITTRGKPFIKVDLSPVLGQAIANLHSKIQETNALIVNNALPFALGDESQLIRVFQNLIENAIKFKSDEAPKINIKAACEGDQLIISVNDNGIGIDMQYRKKVFEIFQRLNSSTDYPGTGIGLAVCKRIIERHGGKIWLESGLGKGTTFYFTLKNA